MTDDKHLSGREEEILQLAARGLTNREIAQALGISPNTVKVHLSNIFEKTGVASRTEATLYGMEHGIVDVPGAESGARGAAPNHWLALIRHFRWVWAAILLLAMVFLVTVTGNLVLPPPTPTPAVNAAEAERWQALAPMPEPRAGMAAAAYDGHIYAIGGEGSGGVSGDVFGYSPEEDTWQTLSAKPTPVRDVQAVLLGEKIFVPGGRLADGGVTDILEIYDPRQDAWEAGARLPKPVSAYALADFEGQMFLFGGWDGEKALDDVWIYDPGANAWRAGTPLPTARFFAGTAVLDDRIIVIGGRDLGSVCKDTHTYFPSRDLAGEDPWDGFIDMPEGRYAFGAASIYDKIYIMGGELAEGAARTNDGLVMTDGRWVPLPTNQAFTGRQNVLVSLGSLLVLLDPAPALEETQVWTYQAFYYSIYIPFVP